MYLATGVEPTKLTALTSGWWSRASTLASGAESGANDGFDGLRHIGVGHDDEVILGAAQGLHALAFGGGGAVDVLRHRGGADEADGLDQRVVEQGGDAVLIAVDQVQHAGGKPRVVE